MPEFIDKYKTERFASTWMVLVLDMVVSAVASMFAVFAVRFFSDPFGSLKHFVYIWTVFALIASFIGFFLCKTSKIIIRHSTYRSIGNLALAVIVKEVILVILIFARVFKHYNLSSLTIECEVVMLDALLSLFSLIMFRVIIIVAFQNMNADDVEANVSKLGVLVYGVSNKSVAMVTRLEYSPNYNILGFVTSDEAVAGKLLQDRKIYLVKDAEALGELKAQLGAQCVLFATDSDALGEKDGLIPMCLEKGIHILNSPRIDDVTFGSMSQQAIQQVSNQTDDYIPDGMSDFERILKRAVDCVLAACLLLVFSPLFLICYIAIKIEDHGPAIYKQERIGRFGRPFWIYKFRSMRLDAEKFGPALYSGDDDPRLTKVGKFLRQHHLDELPQLWCVFTGKMAFIGYRPERKFYIDQIMEQDPRYYYLYQIRPGVTSYATLYNGYTDTIEKMVRRLQYDLYYLRHRSWFFDMKILWMTFQSIAFGKKF